MTFAPLSVHWLAGWLVGLHVILFPKSSKYTFMLLSEHLSSLNIRLIFTCLVYPELGGIQASNIFPQVFQGYSWETSDQSQLSFAAKCQLWLARRSWEILSQEHIWGSISTIAIKWNPFTKEKDIYMFA